VSDQWQQIAEGQTVGYKRICRTPDVTTNKVRIRILDSRVCPTISTFALFLAPPNP
jgi:alpha-L-fucosidase